VLLDFDLALKKEIEESKSDEEKASLLQQLADR